MPKIWVSIWLSVEVLVAVCFVSAFGPPEESELKKPPSSLKNALIQVELFSPSNPSLVFRKKVPFNMTVQKLSGLVQRIFDTGTEVPRLFCLQSSVCFHLSFIS